MSTAGAFLSALRELPVAAPLDVLDPGPLLVLSPHPDDDALGIGGLIAASRAAGRTVHVAVLTDGAGSHPRSAAFPPARLVALRAAETAEAGAALGLSAGDITHLGLPDTRAPTGGADFEAAVARLAALADRVGATTVLVTWMRDPHCDHEAAALMGRALRAARPAIALWSYPIWGWHLDPDTPLDDPPPRGFRLDVAPWLGAKHAAIRAHASQMTDLINDDPDGFRFTPDTLAPFLGRYEAIFMVPA